MTYDAIVMGAGPCGIGAATTFLKAGMTRVVVLEARERVGGRMYTNPDGIDEGGQWLHMSSEGNMVYERAKAMGQITTGKYEVTNMVPTSDDGMVKKVSAKDIEMGENGLKLVKAELMKAKKGETWRVTLRTSLLKLKKAKDKRITFNTI